MANKNFRQLVQFFNQLRPATAVVKRTPFSYVRGHGWLGGMHTVERAMLRAIKDARAVTTLCDAVKIQFGLPFGDSYTSSTPYYKWLPRRESSGSERAAAIDAHLIEKFGPGSAASDDPGVDCAVGGFWDGEWRPLNLKPSELVFENCIVDLETGSVTPHDQESEPIYGPVITAPYDPGATHPDWTDFVHRFLDPNPELAGYVQRVCSVVLVPHYFTKSTLVLVGPSNTGKSTLLAAIAAAPGGFEGHTTFNPHEAETDKFHTFSLLGKFASVCEEFSLIGKGLRWLKSYTGGQFSFEQKFGGRACSTPTAKLLFATNELPDMPEDSKALFYRMIVVPMLNEIAFSEADSNRSTPSYWAEPSRRAAVLAWLIQGLADLVADGFRTEPPASVEAAREAARVQTHPIRRHLHDTYESTEDDEDRVRSTDILGSIRDATADRLSVQRLSAIMTTEFPRSPRESRCKMGSKKGNWASGRGYRRLRVKE